MVMLWLELLQIDSTKIQNNLNLQIQSKFLHILFNMVQKKIFLTLTFFLLLFFTSPLVEYSASIRQDLRFRDSDLKSTN